jgi:imidazolonepropionase-like amidohydrolase
MSSSPRSRPILPPLVVVCSLEPGKLADVSVRSADPTAIAPKGIAAIDVLATVVGDRVTHDRMGLG